MRRTYNLKKYVDLFALNVFLTLSSSYSITKVDSVILADALTADITLTLPDAAVVKGKQYLIKKIDSSEFTVTVESSLSQSIEGETSYIINQQWQSLRIFSNGSAWIIIS